MMFGKTVGRWLDASGPNSESVLSSRLRLARNIRGVPFPNKMSDDEREQVVQRAEQALRKLSFFSPERFITDAALTPLKMHFLTERHLASPGFAEASGRRAVFVGPDETLSLMVNEEDHLRIQALVSGLDLRPALKELQGFDDALGAELGYAFSETHGFLTACPTNVGTGIRASVMLHLPALSLVKEIDRILRGALQVGMVVRGLFGEGTETRGNLFQVSNQVTLGKSEEEIVEVLTRTVTDILTAEAQARDYLMSKAATEIEDKVFRAEAILRSARLLNAAETTNLLGLLRLGVTTGLLSRPGMKLMNELLILVRNANLQVYFGEEMNDAECDARRAELVRARLLVA